MAGCVADVEVLFDRFGLVFQRRGEGGFGLLVWYIVLVRVEGNCISRLGHGLYRKVL